MSPQPRSNTNDNWERLANGLDWFSVGLGLSELIAPGAMGDFIGVRNSSGNRSVLREFMRTRGDGGESRIFTMGVAITEDPVGQVLRWRGVPMRGVRITGARIALKSTTHRTNHESQLLDGHT